jgi:hypothetical protein
LSNLDKGLGVDNFKGELSALYFFKLYQKKEIILNYYVHELYAAKVNHEQQIFSMEKPNPKTKVFDFNFPLRTFLFINPKVLYSVTI